MHAEIDRMPVRLKKSLVDLSRAQGISVTCSHARDLQIQEAWVVAPVREGFPLGEGAECLPLGEALGRLG